MENHLSLFLGKDLAPKLLYYPNKKWKIYIDQKGYGDTNLMDLSEESNIINHQLLIAKLHAMVLAKLLWK